MITGTNPISKRRETSTEAAKETADAFGPFLPGVRPIVEIVREEVTV